MALTLVSHALCPYVQRAAIVLLEKGASFDRRTVDLANKPAWFKAVSPLGKTPVLLVDDAAVFESAVICEYLEDTLAPSLHPADPLRRAQHRAWMAFGSTVLDTIGSYYNAGDAAALLAKREALETRFAQVESELSAGGPYFDGARFSVVDAVFAPVFRYFDAFEAIGEASFFTDTPRVRAWRAALATRASVRDAVTPDFSQRLLAFLRARSSELSRRMAAAQPT
jgi:glutathione S-transferase